MKRYAFLFLMSGSFLFTKGRVSITPADFRLCLDSFGCSDSILSITKKQLLDARVVTPNFSWFKITRLTFYFNSGFGSDVTIGSCIGNRFCGELKPFLDRCETGALLTISAEGINKSGKKVEWRDLSIKIVDATQVFKTL
jgi:hypothetical protein